MILNLLPRIRLTPEERLLISERRAEAAAAAAAAAEAAATEAAEAAEAEAAQAAAEAASSEPATPKAPTTPASGRGSRGGGRGRGSTRGRGASFAGRTTTPAADKDTATGTSAHPSSGPAAPSSPLPARGRPRGRPRGSKAGSRGGRTPKAAATSAVEETTPAAATRSASTPTRGRGTPRGRGSRGGGRGSRGGGRGRGGRSAGAVSSPPSDSQMLADEEDEASPQPSPVKRPPRKGPTWAVSTPPTRRCSKRNVPESDDESPAPTKRARGSGPTRIITSESVSPSRPATPAQEPVPQQAPPGSPPAAESLPSTPSSRRSGPFHALFGLPSPDELPEFTLRDFVPDSCAGSPISSPVCPPAQLAIAPSMEGTLVSNELVLVSNASNSDSELERSSLMGCGAVTATAVRSQVPQPPGPSSLSRSPIRPMDIDIPQVNDSSPILPRVRQEFVPGSDARTEDEVETPRPTGSSVGAHVRIVSPQFYADGEPFSPTRFTTIEKGKWKLKAGRSTEADPVTEVRIKKEPVETTPADRERVARLRRQEAIQLEATKRAEEARARFLLVDSETAAMERNRQAERRAKEAETALRLQKAEELRRLTAMKRAEDEKRLAEANRINEARAAEAARAAEEARLAKEARFAQIAKLEEEKRAAEVEKAKEMARLEEFANLEAEAKLQEVKRTEEAEKLRKAEEARKAKEKQEVLVEERRILQAKRLEEAKVAEETRVAEDGPTVTTPAQESTVEKHDSSPRCARPPVTFHDLSEHPTILKCILQGVDFHSLLAFGSTNRRFRDHISRSLRHISITEERLMPNVILLDVRTHQGYPLFKSRAADCLAKCLHPTTPDRKACNRITYLKKHCGDIAVDIVGPMSPTDPFAPRPHLFCDIIEQLGDRVTQQQFIPSKEGYLMPESYGLGDLVFIQNWRCTLSAVERPVLSSVDNVIYRIDGNETNMRVMTMAKRFQQLIIDFTHWRQPPKVVSSSPSMPAVPFRLLKIAEYAAKSVHSGCVRVVFAGLDEVHGSWLDPRLTPVGDKRPPHVQKLFVRLFDEQCAALSIVPPHDYLEFLHRGHRYLNRFPSIANHDWL